MITGEPVSLAVRAVEDTDCYRIPQHAVLPVLAQPSSLRHLVLSVSGRYEMRAREGLADAEPLRCPVGGLARGEAVVCEPDTSVRDVAGQMAAAGSSIALIDLGDSYGVVTDHDLRCRVVATGAGADTPAREVMTSPARVAAADRPGSDVLVEMLENGLDQLPVTDARGAVLGVVTSSDLIATSVRAPFQLRSEILRAADRDALVAAAGRIPAAAISLYEARVPAHIVSGVIASAHDALTRRLIEIAEAELGPRPAPFTWFALGSFARREAYPNSDQDSALAWDAPLEDELVREWMAAMAERVVTGLEAAGIKPCNAGALATKPLFARPVSDWERLASSWLDNPDQEKTLILVSLVGDGRAVVGDGSMAARMRTAFAQARDRPRLLHLLERAALADRPPTGFRRDLIVEHDGEHRGTLDIKKGGLLPIVDLARSAALAAGAAAASTAARLNAIEAAGTIRASDVTVLRDAFDLVSELRMQHQVQQLRGGEAPDNHIDPATLTPLVRTYLRDAFRAVARVQKGINTSLQYGTRAPAAMG
jgi:CBS domain-containing protein